MNRLCIERGEMWGAGNVAVRWQIGYSPEQNYSEIEIVGVANSVLCAWLKFVPLLRYAWRPLLCTFVLGHRWDTREYSIGALNEWGSCSRCGLGRPLRGGWQVGLRFEDWRPRWG